MKTALRVTEPSEFTLRFTISVAPPAGERWSSAGMAEASRAVLTRAFLIGAAIGQVIDEGCAVPEVQQGETWAGGSSASIEIEHGGGAAIKARIHDAAEAAVAKPR